MSKDDFEEDFDLEEEEDTSEEQEKDWEAEAKKFKAIATRYKKKVEEKKEEPPKEVKPDLIEKEKPKEDSRLDIVEQKVELRMEGYSTEEVDDILAYARAKNISVTEAKKAPLIQKGIEAIRQERKSADETPEPSHRSPVYKGKTFAEVVSSDMSPEEKQSAFEAKMSGKRVNQSE